MNMGNYHRMSERYYDLRPKMFNVRGIDREQSADMVRALRSDLREVFTAKLIRVNGLDNPLMSDDARLVLINEILRDAASRVAGVNAKRARRMDLRTSDKAA